MFSNCKNGFPKCCSIVYVEKTYKMHASNHIVVKSMKSHGKITVKNITISLEMHI
jgi:hypothetical protein